MNDTAYSPTITLWRSLKTLSATRVLIAGILLILLGLNDSKYIWSIELSIYRYICFIYLVGALGFLVLQIGLKRYFLAQLSVQITFDLVVISILFFLSGGINSSLVILYLFPLASCAILAPLTWALLLTSLVALYILLVSSIPVFGLSAETAISNSGLSGAVFMAMVYAVNRFANRLINQEEIALRHKKDLRIQQEINNLVVADMNDGVIVVDRTSCVYACNQASTNMLGVSMIPSVTKLSDMPGLHPISDAFFSWCNHVREVHGAAGKSPGWAETIAITTNDGLEEVGLSHSVLVKGVRRDSVTHLKLRFVFVNAERGKEDERCIIFLQDASEIENQAQQLKLASMGRLTASIAHEVRNPLSSISYAAGLLGESDSNSEQTNRLVKIVSDNVVRLNQLIEDILRLSRKAQIDVEPFLLKPALEEIVHEFQETHKLSPDVIQLAVSDVLTIRFDPLHLREVLVNLMTNAIRYASGKAGSIQLFVIADLDDHLELHVHDDGPGITAEVRAHLFEPFYTTSSHGTGLGLYLARELCLNNGALLDYEYRVEAIDYEYQYRMNAIDAGNNIGRPSKAHGRFVITFVKPK